MAEVARKHRSIYSTEKGRHFHVQMTLTQNLSSGSIVGHRVPELYQIAYLHSEIGWWSVKVGREGRQ